MSQHSADHRIESNEQVAKMTTVGSKKAMERIVHNAEYIHEVSSTRRVFSPSSLICFFFFFFHKIKRGDDKTTAQSGRFRHCF